MANIKENFRFRFHFRSVWIQLKQSTECCSEEEKEVKQGKSCSNWT